MNAERKLTESLEEWGKASMSRLAPLVGDTAASILVDSAISEAIGPRVDQRLDRSPRASAVEPPPSYSEVTEFFQRFSPEAVLSQSPKPDDRGDLPRMIAIRDSVCARVVSELPMTLGAYGRGILAVDWRSIVEELPARTRALQSLASIPSGKQLESSLRAELDEILKAAEDSSWSADTWLRVRFDVIERLRRLRPRIKDQ